MGLSLKSRLLLDNKEVVKGTKQSKEAVREFSNTSRGFVDKFAGAFGISMGQVQGSVKAFQGAIISVSGAQKTAAASTGLFSKALKFLKVALVSTGIGAIVVALGSLVAYFTKSQDGADKLARMMAPLKVAFALVTDAAAAVGRAIVGAFENPKEAITNLWEFIKNQFVNRLEGLGMVIKDLGNLLYSAFTFRFGDVKKAWQDLQSSAMQVLTGLDEQERENAKNAINGAIDATKAKLSESDKLEAREQALEDRRIAFIERRAKLEAEIAKQRVIANDEENYTLQENFAAQQKAIELTKQLYAEQAEIEREATSIMEGQLALSENMREDNRRLAEQRAKEIGVLTQQDGQLRTLLRRQTTLGNKVEKEREEQEKILSLEQQRASLPVLPDAPTLDLPQAEMTIKFPTVEQVRKDTEPILDATEEIGQQFIDFGGLINSGIASFADSLGQLFATGDVEMFADNMLSTFGGLVKSLGQLILAIGTGMLAAEASLKSLNPFVAIAAGAALIALGSYFSNATKQLGGSISNAGNSSGGTINTLPTNATNVQPQTLQVVVSGELKARGNTLVGVINSENNRRNLTT